MRGPTNQNLTDLTACVPDQLAHDLKPDVASIVSHKRMPHWETSAALHLQHCRRDPCTSHQSVNVPQQCNASLDCTAPQHHGVTQVCDGHRYMGSAGSQQAFQDDIARLLNPPRQHAAAPLLTPDSKVAKLPLCIYDLPLGRARSHK